MKNCARTKLVFLLMIIAIIITACTCAAAGGYDGLTEQQQQQQQQQQRQLWIYNILRLPGLGASTRGGAMDDNNLSCVPYGEPCNLYTKKRIDCCPGYVCHMAGALIIGGPMCVVCPREGATCGGLEPCCPGFSCDGTIFGKCHKNN